MTDKALCTIALVGIGNPLAGDDGVGPEVLRQIQERRSGDGRLLFLHLESDLFALADHLAKADHFIFLDAMAGDEPGAMKISRGYQRAFGASLHQTDLGAVMHSLETFREADPFPTWEVWGIVIEEPQEYRVGLSPVIAQAASRMVEVLHEHLSFLLDDTRPSQEDTSFTRPA
jgi:hydrogenase maturation protease